jgi:hypothetical protein
VVVVLPTPPFWLATAKIVILLASAMSLFPAYEHPDTASNTLPFNSVLNESSSTDVSRETINFLLSNVSRETLHYLKRLSDSGFAWFDQLRTTSLRPSVSRETTELA